MNSLQLDTQAAVGVSPEQKYKSVTRGKKIMPNFSLLALTALQIVEASGTIIRSGYRRPHTIHHKGRIDLVTETDLAVERFLKEKLQTVLPDVQFLAEESASDLTPPDTCWIIDPVDGTTNFAHGLPFVATSVALRQQGKLVLGIVNAPLLGECFIAEKSKGAWMNGEKIYVSQINNLEKALIATGFPYDINLRVDTILRRLKPILATTQGVRRCGAAALDLAWTACGRFDAYYEDGLKPWDTAAGTLILEEAGGQVTDMEGKPYGLGSSVLASNTILHTLLLEQLARTQADNCQ